MFSTEGKCCEETEHGTLQSHILFSFAWCRNGTTPLNPRELLCVYSAVIKGTNTFMSLCLYENIIINLIF